MTRIALIDIETHLGAAVLDSFGDKDISVKGYSLLSAPKPETIFFIRKISKEIDFKDVKRCIVIVPQSNVDSVRDTLIDLGCFVFVVADPRLSFLRVLNQFFVERRKPGIHPTAVIAKDVFIPSSCYIGPYVVVEEGCEIGKNAILHSHVTLYSNVQIGENVILHSGVVLGADGLGFQKNENGEYEKFPQLGGVVLGDNVEIGANSCVDRGALGPTIIHDGVKMDNHVHVAHNVEIQKNSILTANAMVAGGTKIGQGCWLAPSSSLVNGITIGDHVFVGMGADVLENVSDHVTVMGSPAKSIREYTKLQRALKKLAGKGVKS